MNCMVGLPLSAGTTEVLICCGVNERYESVTYFSQVAIQNLFSKCESAFECGV